MLPKVLRTAGSPRSTGITPLRRYCGPIRHPLAFGRLPGIAGYTAYLLPPLSQRGEEGFTSCSTRPCHRAAAAAPPEWSVASASLRRPMLPSPNPGWLGLWDQSVSRSHLRSLSLRPGGLLTTPKVALSMGFRSLGFPPDCHPRYRASGCCPGGTASHWTRQPSLVAPGFRHFSLRSPEHRRVAPPDKRRALIGSGALWSAGTRAHTIVALAPATCRERGFP